jgi:hypothetical protein
MPWAWEVMALALSFNKAICGFIHEHHAANVSLCLGTQPFQGKDGKRLLHNSSSGNSSNIWTHTTNIWTHTSKQVLEHCKCCQACISFLVSSVMCPNLCTSCFCIQSSNDMVESCHTTADLALVASSVACPPPPVSAPMVSQAAACFWSIKQCRHVDAAVSYKSVLFTALKAHIIQPIVSAKASGRVGAPWRQSVLSAAAL